MSAVATPVLAWVSNLVSNAAVSNTANYTVTVHLTQGWQTVIPVKIGTPHTTGVSLGATISVYRSMDGGTNFDSIALVPIGMPRPTAADQTQQISLKLETGQYAIQIQAGGNGTATTWTVSVLTQMVITAINNV